MLAPPIDDRTFRDSGYSVGAFEPFILITCILRKSYTKGITEKPTIVKKRKPKKENRGMGGRGGEGGGGG